MPRPPVQHASAHERFVARQSPTLNFQVTVLKVLASHPDGRATMADLKRDMAILAKVGREWTERTKRLASGAPDLNIFSQGLVLRDAGSWRITERGREVLEQMERHSTAQTSPPAAEIDRPATGTAAGQYADTELKPRPP